ncbi:phosphoribosylformylglycinamidine cyclo-ligase [bacterium]|nr:phosphoribosylformylglycinamidine cyclo-ligase [bacterium]
MNHTYAQAGVDIESGENLVRRIQTFASGIGGFAGTYPLGDGRLLAAATDGVGTKLELAQRLGNLEGLGQDLVAMCVNDLITIGARPLFFLDYYACGKLDVISAEQVIFGIQQACAASNCLLLGGETAEMPGFYPDGRFDLAGFAVGLIAPGGLIDGSNIVAGDTILGLPSSGLHSNGFSLVRKILGDQQPSWMAELLTPTQLYVKPILGLLNLKVPLKGMAHVTGGGYQNLHRVLPPGRSLKLDWEAWALPPIFQRLQKMGNVESEEMRRVFNCGIGMALFVDPAHVQTIQTVLPEVVRLGVVQ